MSKEDPRLLQFCEFTIDPVEQTLWRDEEPIPLPPKVMKTLCLLVENAGRLMTKEELLNQLWADTFVEERNLTQNIFTIRKALRDGEGDRKLIETLPKRGYRFIAPVRPVETADRNTPETGSDGPAPRVIAEEQTPETQQPPEAADRGANGTADASRIPVDRHGRRSFFYLVAALISLLIFVGGLVWSWQNGWLTAPDFASASDAKRPLLEFERLSDSGKVFFPVVSPNKQFFAYVLVDQGKYSIELQNIATGSKTVVVAPANNEIGPPAFSADGNYVFYRLVETIGTAGVVYRVPVLGGTPRSIVRGVNSDISVSPDGEWLAFVRLNAEINGQQLIICRSADGSEQRVVATRRDNESFQVWGYQPVWTLDGKRIFVTLLAERTSEKPNARGEGFGLIDVDDGTFESVKTPEWNSFDMPKWMPDGKSLLFLARERASEPFQIWQVKYPSGEGRRVTNDAHDYRYLSIAPDGEFILTTQAKTYFNLWSIPIETPHQAKQLTFSKELRHGDRGIAWTIDGRHLVYTLMENSADGDLTKIDLQTLESRQLTFDKRHLNWNPRVTPDGGSVIFSSNRENGTHIWQMDTEGRDLRQITHGPGESFPAITGNGEWLIYASPAWDPDALFKMPLTGDGPAIKLISGAAGSNSVSPDGKHLIVSYRSKSEDGKVEFKYGVMAPEPNKDPVDLGFNPYYGAMAWKPDSSGFYYVKDHGRSLSNIWFFNLRAKGHEQITYFGDRMSSLALSPDGKTLATARGETISNVFKIRGL